MGRNGQYAKFIEGRRHTTNTYGFKPICDTSYLYDFQQYLFEWALWKGRDALFCDCGLGKTPMQLAWADNVVQKTNKRVLILTPLAVSYQTVNEGDKFGVEVARPIRRGTEDHTVLPRGSKVIVTNYEQLRHFDSSDFVGVVCDESSILKNADGATRVAVTRFLRKMPYRLLCTATAAPNDYIELGTSSEALGAMGFQDMLSKFFKKQQATTSRKDEYKAGLYRFRGHAERDFWRWVCSWARACSKPSDLGFKDGAFQLPELVTEQHVIQRKTSNDLADLIPAVGLNAQRRERSRTLTERCEMVAGLVDHDRPAVSWCHLNAESTLLTKIIPDAVEVCGKHPDQYKEEAFQAFQAGEIRVLVTKPTIAGHGLNWQHCAHETFFPSHSFEQWYQAIRRCWRFGQTDSVKVDIVTSPAEAMVLQNMETKAKAADKMFANLIEFMYNELGFEIKDNMKTKEVLPAWLGG